MKITNGERQRICHLLAGSTVANTRLIACAVGWDINKTRRVLDVLVSEGMLGKEQSTFWNGMHYAKRNYYWINHIKKGKVTK